MTPCSIVLALIFASGETPDAATPNLSNSDAAPSASDTSAAAAPERPTRLERVELKRLPDGFFAGTVDGPAEGMTIHLTVVRGVVTRFEIRTPGQEPMRLRPNASPADTGLRFGGKTGDSFLRTSGGFEDSDRAFGRFEGTFDKRRVQGTWRLVRQ